MDVQSFLLLPLLLGAAANTPALAQVTCPLTAYEVERHAQTTGRPSRATRIGQHGSCRISSSQHGLSLEAIPSLNPPTRCRFVLFGEASLSNGWRIQNLAIDTNSNGLHLLASKNKLELEADDPNEIEHVLVTRISLSGPSCAKWHQAFEP